MKPKPEGRRPKAERSPKPETSFTLRFSDFFRPSWIRPSSFLALASVLVLAGCATSTIEKRRVERQPAYQALAPEQRTLVDQGQIRAGMNQDAVYIAWGKPAQKLQSEGADGLTETWLYSGSTLDDYRYWTFREYRERDGSTRLERVLESDYQIRDFISAEIVFTNAVVKSWRTLPAPPSRGGAVRGY